DTSNKTELVIVNPGTANSTVTVTMFNARGQQAGITISQTVTAHAAFRLPASGFGANPAAGTFSARISSSLPVTATAIINRSDSLLFAPGQPMDQPSSLR